MNEKVKIVLSLGIGVLAGASLFWLLGGEDGAATDAQGERKPLYWVAPMNPDYRSDSPGKSPMGMDLIPVYENDTGQDDSSGTVRISPDVVNNLGVRTALVVRGELDVGIRTVGYVRYDEEQLVHIHPRVEGWIETLYVEDEGEAVAKGTALYDLYSPTLVNAQEELLVALQHGNTRLIAAAEKRLAALNISANTISALKKRGSVRQTVTVRAPQAGIVDNLSVRQGMYVKPGMVTLSIGALDPIWVEGEVFERQAALVAAGDPVVMQLDYLPGRRWTGEVDYVYPTVDNKTRTVSIRARFDNADRALKPGMFTQLEIEPDIGGKTLLVPSEALIRTGGKPRVVLAMGEGRFKSIEVELGRVGNKYVEVLSGLSEGERIVTSALFLIDSESSKTSDFQRMNHDNLSDMSDRDSVMSEQAPQHGEAPQ